MLEAGYEDDSQHEEAKTTLDMLRSATIAAAIWNANGGIKETKHSKPKAVQTWDVFPALKKFREAEEAKKDGELAAILKTMHDKGELPDHVYQKHLEQLNAQ